MIKIKDSSGTVTTAFEGRVIEVRTFTATRNHSDTLDYTDYRDTEVTEALVWLGTHGVPGRAFPGSWEEGKARELLPHEQFAVVDCTNLFAWRAAAVYTAEVDVHPTDGRQPLLWANHIAWQGYNKAAAAAAAARLEALKAKEAEIAEENARRAAARAAKAEAKAAASKAAADALLAKAPKKGTVVTVGSFKGKVFWTGAAKHRGAYAARVGVRDSRGETRWFGVEELS